MAESLEEMLERRAREIELGDNHPEWSGPDKGTHGWAGVLACLFSIVLVITAAYFLWPRR